MTCCLKWYREVMDTSTDAHQQLFEAIVQIARLLVEQAEDALKTQADRS